MRPSCQAAGQITAGGFARRQFILGIHVRRRYRWPLLILRAVGACIKALFWPRFTPTFRRAGDPPHESESAADFLMAPRLSLTILTMAAALVLPGTSALAANCGTGSFDAWLADFKTEAAGKGFPKAAINAGLNGVTLDQSVLSRDRSQKVFSQSFEEFSGRMVPPRLTRGANLLKQYGSVLGRIEQNYGVPGEVLVAIWGVETDFGVNTGKFPTMRSLAPLAYDCRRSEMFKAELMDA